MMNKQKGKLNLDLLEICKSCKIEFGDTSILRHLKDPACRKDYDLEELEYITGWSEKRKELVYFDYYERNKEEIKQRSKERWAENKESILNQRREHLEKKRNDKQQLLKKCKSCNKKLGETKIKANLAPKESWKRNYSEDELKYIDDKAAERKKLRDSKYYETHKVSIAARKSGLCKKKTLEKKEEFCKKCIEGSKRLFDHNKTAYEKDGRTRNSFNHEVRMKNFSQAFPTFKEMKMKKRGFRYHHNA